MGRRIIPNSMLRMPGVPEDEDIVGPPETAKIIPDEITGEKEAPLMGTELLEEPESIAQREAALEAERFAASPQGRYSAALKAAAEAGPTAEDYRSAALRRSIGEMRAGMPSYLQQMSTTLFHKPDFSGQAAAAKARLERPEYEIKGKEAEQKRLQDIAEGARKEAMLPAEMAEKRAKTLKTEADIKALESKGAPLSEVRRKLYENQINKFITQNKLGDPVQLPEGVTESDAGRLFMAAQKGDTTSWRSARLEFDKAEARAKQQRFEASQEAKGLEKAEKQVEKELIVDGEAYKGRTTAEAKELRGSVAAFNAIKGSLNDLKTQYANINLDNYQNVPRAVQEMNTIGKDLIMRIKDLYGLGAPQTAELQFLYGLLGTSPDEVLKNVLMDKTLGTSFPEKLDTIERVYKNGVKSALEAKAVKKEEGEAPATKPKKVQPPPAKPSTPATKPARKVITDPNEL